MLMSSEIKSYNIKHLEYRIMTADMPLRPYGNVEKDKIGAKR